LRQDQQVRSVDFLRVRQAELWKTTRFIRAAGTFWQDICSDRFPASLRGCFAGSSEDASPRLPIFLPPLIVTPIDFCLRVADRSLKVLIVSLSAALLPSLVLGAPSAPAPRETFLSPVLSIH
jgi:hypothetical protein